MDAAQLTHTNTLAPQAEADVTPRAAAEPGYRDRIVRAAVRQLLADNPEFRKYTASSSPDHGGGLVDFLIAVEDDPHVPDEVFGRLRWGGQYVYLSRDRRRVEEAAHRFTQRGFELIHGPGAIRAGPIRFLPWLGRRLHFFIARKIYLIRPREITERFTYHVQLSCGASAQCEEYVVMKEVPMLERVIGRLRAKFTDVPQSVIEKRAMKFTEKIFPLFLTREAAMLKILQRDLPPEYRKRVPTLLDAEKDDRGYVRRMWMNWLRIGGRPLTQIEFARQSAELLRAVHDDAKIIHLDLRLDNFVITEDGVGFVDFGSAVRVGENIQGNPLLSTLFEELMRTSQIQRMLYKMQTSGSITSYIINDACGKVDKAVDLFYLAVQISQPLNNPDLAGLIRYDPDSPQARALARLTQDVLKPADKNHPRYRTAADMLNGIREIEAIHQTGPIAVNSRSACLASS